jgi:cation:H+ antiporter
VALAIVLLLAGTAVLAVGAESAIRGAVRFAKARGVSPFVIGAVMFGIDVESLGAALIAAGRGQTAIAAGEAFGTIVFLLSVAFGAALLLSPEPIESPRAQMVLLPAVGLIAGGLTLADGEVDRLEGLALVVAFAVYIWMVIMDDRTARLRGEEVEREAEEGPRIPSWMLLGGGLVMVYVGATVMVEGGVRLLDRTSLAAGFVGAAIIGSLASVDEVVLEVLPVRRGYPELATGNLFGTITAFSTGVLGLAALVRPLQIDGAAGSAFVAASVLYGIIATAFLARGRAGKVVGLMVLAAYGGWLALGSRV